MLHSPESPFFTASGGVSTSLLVLLSVLGLLQWGDIEVKGHEEGTRSRSALSRVTERLASFSS